MVRRADRRSRSAPRPASGATAGVPARRGAVPARVAAVAAALLALAALAWWRQSRPGAAAEGADPVAALPGRAALDEGMRLGAAGRHAESIPYFRHAIAAMDGFWAARYDLATALANAALQVRPHGGRIDPLLRSSVERVRNLQEADRELERALPSATSRRALATMLDRRAQVYLTWGMPVDALEWERRARAADPAWSATAANLAHLERDLARGGTAP